MALQTLAGPGVGWQGISSTDANFGRLTAERH